MSTLRRPQFWALAALLVGCGDAAPPGPGGANVSSTTSSSSSTSGGATASPGAFLWAKRAGGPDNEGSTDIAALGDGSALVTGRFSGTATFGAGEPGETTLTSSGASDMFGVKYAP